MTIRSLFWRYTAANKSAALGWAVALVILIAVFDWRVKDPVPLGFLYLLPMFLFGRLVNPWFIAAAAVLCTGLAEAYDGIPLTLYAGASRMLLYFSAFATTGLFVRQISIGRQQIQSHIQEIEAQRDALREAENQLEALIESSPAAIVTTDSRGKILMANEAAHRLFGVTANSLPSRFVQPYLPSLANISDGASSRPRFRAVMQARGVREDGDVFLADICFSTYPTASGMRLTAMIVDSSEDLRQHEESSLKQLMAGSRLVAGAMSHEIRNVCAAIAVVCQNLERSGRMDGNKDFEALGGLIHTLEEVAAIELRYANTQSSVVDLVGALNDLRIVITPSLQEEEIEAAWEFDSDLPKVWADRSQLMQIFLNLAGNSIRALSEVEHRGFGVKTRTDENRVFVEFSDSGGGVRDTGQLFRPFQQGAVSSGLGLYLSRAFARSVGGDLRYSPSPGRACFILELLVAGPLESGMPKDASG